jgi:molybdate transport system regulatory protein
MKISARNQLSGTVTAVRAGAVNDEVDLALSGGASLVAVITRESVESLALRPGQRAIALVKASNVLLATDLTGYRISARNQLHAKVGAITPGAVNAEVMLELDGGQVLVAIVTQASVKTLDLAPGAPVTALVKASDVMLAVAV